MPIYLEYDSQVSMWVSHDPEYNLWSQGNSMERAIYAIIDARESYLKVCGKRNVRPKKESI